MITQWNQRADVDSTDSVETTSSLTKSGEVLRAKGYGNANLRMWYWRIKEMLLQLDLLGFTAGSYAGMAL